MKRTLPFISNTLERSGVQQYGIMRLVSNRLFFKMSCRERRKTYVIADRNNRQLTNLFFSRVYLRQFRKSRHRFVFLNDRISAFVYCVLIFASNEIRWTKHALRIERGMPVRIYGTDNRVGVQVGRMLTETTERVRGKPSGATRRGLLSEYTR